MHSVVMGPQVFKYHDLIKELEFLGEMFVHKPEIYGSSIHQGSYQKLLGLYEKDMGMKVLLQGQRPNNLSIKKNDDSSGVILHYV